MKMKTITNMTNSKNIVFVNYCFFSKNVLSVPTSINLFKRGMAGKTAGTSREELVKVAQDLTAGRVDISVYAKALENFHGVARGELPVSSTSADRVAEVHSAAELLGRKIAVSAARAVETVVAMPIIENEPIAPSVGPGVSEAFHEAVEKASSLGTERIIKGLKKTEDEARASRRRRAWWIASGVAVVAVTAGVTIYCLNRKPKILVTHAPGTTPVGFIEKTSVSLFNLENIKKWL